MSKQMKDMSFAQYEKASRGTARKKAKGKPKHFSVEQLDDGTYKSHTTHEMSGDPKSTMMMGDSMTKTASHPTINDAADHMIAAFSGDRAVGKKPKSSSPHAKKAEQANDPDTGQDE